MRICIVAGHTTTGKGTGANGYINESNENRVLSKLAVDYLKKAGHTVDYKQIDNDSNYLANQVKFANAKTYDLVVQIHFNANTTTSNPMGTETLYKSTKGKEWANKVTNKLGTLYKQRGVKYRDNLYWLNNTNAPAILIEVCFVDSKADIEMYKANKDKTARLIAEGIHGKSIVDSNTNIIKIKIDGQYYNLEGMLVNGTNYLKVRELEKAGYKIGFEGSIATIDKP